MLLTQEEIYTNYKISRSTLLKWEREEVLKEVVKLPNSKHRRYKLQEIEAVLNIGVI